MQAHGRKDAWCLVMSDDFDGLGWREYMRGIENGNIDPTGERLRAVCRLAREAIEAMEDPVPQTERGEQ